MKYEYNKSYDIDYTELDSNANITKVMIFIIQN